MMISKDTDQPHTIYTIGHSNAPAEKIIQLLATYGVKLLVDVRSVPYSRHNPQFNRGPFTKTLEKAGIEYLYLGDSLGGWPNDPTCYINGKIPETKKNHINLVDYSKVMNLDIFKNGILLLLDNAVKTPTALMCSEEDPSRCHRHYLIGAYLTRNGVDVLHIRGDGNIVKDQQLTKLSGDPSSKQPNLF